MTMTRPNLTPSLADQDRMPVPGHRYWPAWQRRDPHGWNLVRVESIEHGEWGDTVMVVRPHGRGAIGMKNFCDTYAEETF